MCKQNTKVWRHAWLRHAYNIRRRAARVSTCDAVKVLRVGLCFLRRRRISECIIFLFVYRDESGIGVHTYLRAITVYICIVYMCIVIQCLWMNITKDLYALRANLRTFSAVAWWFIWRREHLRRAIQDRVRDIDEDDRCVRVACLYARDGEKHIIVRFLGCRFKWI